MRQTNPNYRVPAVQIIDNGIWAQISVAEAEGTIKGANWNVSDLTPNDLLICSPTVSGFSLNDK
jgi:hypothetical protein